MSGIHRGIYMNLIIKKCETNKEKDGRAFVHHTAWQETYQGLVPDALLERMSFENCRKIAYQYPENTLAALADEQVVGFISFLPVSRSFVSIQPSCEIVGLYVLKKHQKSGIGTALLNECIDILPPSPILLFVLERNEKAIRFYKQKGFRFTGKKIKQDVIGGQLIELEMVLER
jgi:ribosomal protein S18 acetylase RimI-like enzyme